MDSILGPAMLAAALILSPSPARTAASIAKDGAIRLTDEQALEIGRKIWRNESGGSVRGLTHWNKGEEFGSFGIGHFIWYPAGRRGPFTESFPGLLDALELSGRTLPGWLSGMPPCPWPDRDAFWADFDGPRLTELRALLAASVNVQARYAADRLEAALPKILAAAPPTERGRLKARFGRVASVANGVYALVDYVNFKGEGVNPSERYAGAGWGLLQVLEGMEDLPAGRPSVESFVRSADAALTRRVANSPPERGEAAWLPGWRKRLQTYLD